MIFNINKIKKQNLDLYNKDAINIARAFTNKIYKEMTDIIKMAVLFG